MNIMVFDVPAEKGGALSVLNDFYNEVIESEHTNINWIFVLSNPILNETENIRVLRFPWIKKSWGHRLYFDQVVAPKLVKQYKVDKVFSLQNITIPRVNCEQILYVHQPLPFVDYKFSFKDNRLFWVYQNIIGKNIINSINKSQWVIVQTEWMRQAVIEKAKVDSLKVEIIPPTINLEVKKYFGPNDKSLSTFFYPASGAEYKNHQVIVDASKKLKKLGKINHEVIFTLNGDENNHIRNLYRLVHEEQLPIRFEGNKTRNEVFDLYTKSILIFPSYIETFGLPMLEARMHKGIILAAETPFALEILKGYENVKYFEASNSKELCVLMQQYINKKVLYKPQLEVQQNEIKHERKLITLLT
ncbi:glycosyltransferase [Peribacillus butanolivorans]|uniref:glycosyltransferase n=1 Tax=Peribacillus butanolivorans TaxID=421767 RepID=UPI003D2AD9F9